MKKKIILIFLALFIISFVGFWSIVSGGYDKQNKTILFLKKIIPSHLAKKARDTVFIIPELKEQNKFLALQVKKYEQGYNGSLFNEQIILSENKKKKYNLKEFFLPFPRLDIRLGWAATENSRRAHYLEIVEDKIFSISGLGETIYFDRKNINKKKLDQKVVENNIKDILLENKAELIGIRDLYYDDNNLYISLQHKDKNGFTINVYRAVLNTDKLIFKLFFETKEYWPNYNVFSGGRLEKFKDNKILFSIGFAYEYYSPQNKNSFLGKIISIDKASSKHELVSYGHRNPQGLFYLKKNNMIINTEHGPKGGDEINFNNLNYNKKEASNFGWPISSYGRPYPGEEKIFEKNGWLEKSHKINGFIEPVKYFDPAIGISEIIYLSEKKTNSGDKLYVSSLRAGSIYLLDLDKELKNIIGEDRLFFENKRIRDLKFDADNNVFLIVFEFTPSIGVLSIN